MHVQSGSKVLSSQRLNHIIDSFAPALYTHLSDEICTICSLANLIPKINIIQLWRDGGKDRQDMNARLANELLFMLNHDAIFEDASWANFPPVSVTVRDPLLHGADWKDLGWRKFASCDVDGRPKELYALQATG